MVRFMEGYYGPYAAAQRRRQAAYAGPAAGFAPWLDGYAKAGAAHLCIRFAGEHDAHLSAMKKVRASLGW
jgi:hypothetical protein